jgi:arylsulfatase A-like enzyme
MLKRNGRMRRRAFIRAVGAGAAAAAAAAAAGAGDGLGSAPGLASRNAAAADGNPGARPDGARSRRPNLLFVFADQWRAQATRYAGDPNARTPNLDALAAESVRLTNAVSTCPVSSPYRGSLVTGQYPLTHGVFVNDVYLQPRAVSIAQAYRRAGYETGYIGKWHLDGHGSRSAYIPRERRQGFDFWMTLECTHDYNNSFYYGDDPAKRRWEGYDAIAQTREAQRYLRSHATGPPFALFMSWGPPHDPYETAPTAYRAHYDPRAIALRPNVPAALERQACNQLAGYYAHIEVLDACVGDLVATLKECGLEENTILVFTSDHGDMHFSHGGTNKQQPWDESVLVPFLIRHPAGLRAAAPGGRAIPLVIGTPDIMPTLLGLSGVEIPATCEGEDLSDQVRGSKDPGERAALIMCPSPFGQWTRQRGGREYRGIRTRRFTYVRDLEGPWLLYDNDRDSYQLENLCRKPEYAKTREELEGILREKLTATRDEFLPGAEYLKKWGYAVDASGTVPYTP